MGFFLKLGPRHFFYHIMMTPLHVKKLRHPFAGSTIIFDDGPILTGMMNPKPDLN